MSSAVAQACYAFALRPKAHAMSDTAPEQFSIGRVAEAAGVSAQTVRIWERRGLISANRTDGGHRVFSQDMVRRTIELAAAARRTRPQQRPEAAGAESLELASTGMRIRRARLAKALSQVEAATRIGISRSFLAAVERGESGVSVQVLARMADTFGLSLSQFAPHQASPEKVMRVADRPRTVLAGGVTWEELAAPGRYKMEPAMLHIPPGQSSGGAIIRPGDDFIYVIEGELIVAMGERLEDVRLQEGDALTVEGGTPMTWRNPGQVRTECLWVELIVPRTA
jgi:transcriptional regulator with XRE-family HTH domain